MLVFFFSMEAMRGRTAPNTMAMTMTPMRVRLMGPSQEDAVVAAGQGQGPLEVFFEHGPQDQSKDQRGEGDLDELEDVAEDAGAEHDQDVERAAVDGVGAQEHERQDGGHEVVEGDFQHRDPDPGERDVEDRAGSSCPRSGWR